MTVPAIETERLRLRAHRADDLAASVAMWNDPLVMRHITGKASSERDGWFRILRYAGHWPLLGFGYWAVEDKATGEFAGELGFADFKREIVPSIAGVPELGWVLAANARGKGYATEGVAAALAWADAQLAAPKTACIISPANLQSLRVAEKCGYGKPLQTTFMDEPTLLLSRSRRAS